MVKKNGPFCVTRNELGLKKIHDLTHLNGARPYDAMFLLHGALTLIAMLFSNVAPQAYGSDHEFFSSRFMWC
jgi:hypothetical protein